MTHWAKLRREPSNIIRTIVCDGQVAGNIGSWIAEDQRLIGYWIGREFWGRGVATAALAAFVAEVNERPLHAFVAKHNVGSIRVLEKCEFVPSPEHDPSIAGEDGIHEVLYMLSRRGRNSGLVGDSGEAGAGREATVPPRGKGIGGKRGFPQLNTLVRHAR
jgi:RimJ/RimL family protein N-acetyltransferase